MITETAYEQELIPVGFDRFEEKNRLLQHREELRQRQITRNAANRLIRVRRRQSRKMEPKALLGICGGTLLLVIACVFFVMQTAALEVNQRETERLRSTYTRMVAENQVLEASILSSIDIAKIGQYAMEELGMSYPSKGQVVYYTRTEQHYVRQEQILP